MARRSELAREPQIFFAKPAYITYLASSVFRTHVTFVTNLGSLNWYLKDEQKPEWYTQPEWYTNISINRISILTRFFRLQKNVDLSNSRRRMFDQKQNQCRWFTSFTSSSTSQLLQNSSKWLQVSWVFDYIRQCPVTKDANVNIFFLSSERSYFDLIRWYWDQICLVTLNVASSAPLALSKICMWRRAYQHRWLRLYFPHMPWHPDKRSGAVENCSWF